MSSVLSSEPVGDALRELREIGEREDARYWQRVQAREAELGLALGAADRAPFAVEAPLAISSRVGEVLHALVLATRPSLVVEFGASLGISTIYLASALADLGTGRVVTTELVAQKAERTAAVLERAGLGEYVEVLVGDALQTLRGNRRASRVAVSRRRQRPVSRCPRTPAAASGVDRDRGRRHELRGQEPRGLPRLRQRRQ